MKKFVKVVETIALMMFLSLMATYINREAKQIKEKANRTKGCKLTGLNNVYHISLISIVNYSSCGNNKQAR